MRGEHESWRIPRFAAGGSSPHARGAPARADLVLGLSGIIPACAGSTEPPWSQPRHCRDHPRMRGEHYPAARADLVLGGSSPHARGARLCIAPRARQFGIIPACAGSTSRVSSSGLPSGDHPRMRGEHLRERDREPRRGGSSPHARGAHHHRKLGHSNHRIIPACAGSTTKSRKRLA